MVWNDINVRGVNPFTSVIRVKLLAALADSPGNHRLLEDAAKLLAKKCRSENRMTHFDARQLRSTFLQTLEVLYGISTGPAAGIPAGRSEPEQSQTAKRNKSRLIGLKPRNRTYRDWQAQTSKQNESSVL